MRVPNSAPGGASSTSAPGYQVHSDPIVAAMLAAAAGAAQLGEVWTLTVTGDGDGYHLERISDTLDPTGGGHD